MTIWYVSNAGNDSNTGLSALEPWLTVNKVNTAAAAHDTIRFRGGDVFQGTTLVPKAGQQFESYGTGRATLAYGDVNGVSLAVGSVSFDNLIFEGGQGGAGTAISIDLNANAGRLRRCLFRFGGSHLISTAASTGTMEITETVFERSLTDSCSLHGALSVTIRRCQFLQIGVDTVGGAADPISMHDTGTFLCEDTEFFSCQRGVGLSVNDSGTNVLRRCLIVTTSQTTSAGNYVVGLVGTGSLLMENCICLLSGTTAQYGVYLETGTAIVRNCTFLSVNTNSGTISLAAASGTLTVTNCVSVVPTATGVHLADGSATGVDAVESNYNCFFPDGAAKFSVTQAPVLGPFAGWQAFTGQDAQSVTSDPLMGTPANFTTPTIEPARLNPRSVCVGMGTDQFSVNPTDYLGRSRRLSGWHLGALVP